MLLNEMLLLEDSGNLRKLSPTVLKCFIKYDHDGNIGSNSVIRILPYNKSTIKKIIEDRELLAGFVLRYGQEDLISIIFSSRIGEGYFYYRLIKTNFVIFNRLKKIINPQKLMIFCYDFIVIFVYYKVFYIINKSFFFHKRF